MRQAQNALERLHGRVSHFSYEPVWTALTLIFCRAIFDSPSWKLLLESETSELAGRIDAELDALRVAFPHQFADSRLLERVRDLNGATPIRDLLEQADAAFLRLTAEPHLAGDPLGSAYMLLLSKRRAQARGEFYTPSSVALMMARMLAPRPGQRVLDPACGSGRLLLAALDACRERHGTAKSRTVQLYGIELNYEIAQVARLNMVLAGAGGQALIAHADALAGPVFTTRTGEPATFEVVIANPPFGR